MAASLWEIMCRGTGVTLGVYAGDTEADALDAMARDAGYDNYASAETAVPGYTDLLVAPTVRLPKIVRSGSRLTSADRRRIVYRLYVRGYDPRSVRVSRTGEVTAKLDRDHTPGCDAARLFVGYAADLLRNRAGVVDCFDPQHHNK